MLQMELTGKEFKELQEALLSAFPSYSSLEQMVKFKLNENLKHIVSKTGLSDVVFKLIGWAESEGKVEELVRGAREQNSRNPKLKAFADKYFTTPSEKPIQANIPLQLPPPVANFTGREEELKQLLGALQLGKVVTLCGPGGIGKSALAAEAIWRLAPDNSPPDTFPDGIIYHDFYAHPQTTLALEEIIRAFGLDSIEGPPALAAKRVLAGRQALLVLDGAEEADDLRVVLDARNGCGVLITTRDRKQAYGKLLDISSLSIEKAVALLQAWGGSRAANEMVAQQICEQVDGFPLAVCLVGHYLFSNEEDANDYLEWLKDAPLEALNEESIHFKSVFRVLEKSVAQVSPEAQEALAVVGLLGFAPFDQTVIAAILDMKGTKARRSLGELVNYGLLVRRKKLYEVNHALVHTYAREGLAMTDENEARFINYFFQKAQEAASREDFSRSSGDAFEVIDQLHPHILKALEKLKEPYAKEGDTARQQMIDFVEALDKYWQVHNEYQVSLIWLEEAYHCASYLKKPRHQAKFAYARARILYLQGDFKQAKADCLRGLEIINETEHPEAVAQGNNLLGTIYRRSGKYSKGLEALERSLAIWQRLKNKLQIARVEDNLGTAYFNLHQLNRARQFYERGLQYWKTFPDQRYQAIALNNLAGVDYAWAQSLELADSSKITVTEHYQKAAEYCRQAVAISSSLEEPRLLAATSQSLTWPLIALGDWDEAESYLKQSLEIQRTHQLYYLLPETYRAQAELAIERQQCSLAIILAQDALAEAEKQGNQAEEGAANRVLGKAYRLRGALDKAEKYLKTSLSQLQAINNPFETALTWRELALLYDKQGREEEAQEAETQVQAILVQMGIIPEEQ